MAPLDRRAFLRSSLGAAAAVGAASRHTRAVETGVREDKTEVRLAVVRADLLPAARVEGFRVVKIYDDNVDRARAFSATLQDRPVVCETLEQAAEGIEAAYVAGCEGSQSDPLKTVQPFLRKGIPILLDKSFAPTLRDAGRIVGLAQQRDAPLLSESAVNCAPAVMRFKRQWGEVRAALERIPAGTPKQPLGVGVVKIGGGGPQVRPVNILRGVCLALDLFGRGVDSVEAMGDSPLEYVHLRLSSGAQVILLAISSEDSPQTCTLRVSVYGQRGAIHSDPIGHPEFLQGAAVVFRMFHQMIQTRRPPIPYRDLVEPIAILEAARLSQSSGSKILLRDFWKASPQEC